MSRLSPGRTEENRTWRAGDALRQSIPGAGAIASSKALAALLSIVAFFGVWKIVSGILAPELIPPPTDVLGFMWDAVRGDTTTDSTVWAAFGKTLWRLGVGLAGAFVLGFVVGLLSGASKVIEGALHDFVIVGLAVPSLVWALLCGIYFGLGNAAPVGAVVLAATPYVVLNTHEGVRAVPADLTTMAKAYGVGWVKVARHVIVPSLMPFLFASLRYGLSAGWKALAIAEVFASNGGAGWMIEYWQTAYRIEGVLGYALFFVIVALLLEWAVYRPLSQYIFRWRRSTDV